MVEEVPDSETVIQDWDARGFDCECEKDPPGDIRRGDVRDTDELIMVLHGDMEVEVDGKTVHPRNGEEVLIHAWARRNIRNVGKTLSEWLHGCEGDQAQTD